MLLASRGAIFDQGVRSKTTEGSYTYIIHIYYPYIYSNTYYTHTVNWNTRCLKIVAALYNHNLVHHVNTLGAGYIGDLHGAVYMCCS